VLVADGEGWLVAWILENTVGPGEVPGLYVARPGSAPRHIDTGPGIMTALTGIVTNSGTLLCWQPNGVGYAQTSCVVIDSSLGVVRPPAPVMDRGIAELIPTSDGPLAVSTAFTAATGPWLQRLDDFGTPVGPEVPLPCVPSAYNDVSLACLGLMNEQWQFNLVNYDGSSTSSTVNVAPLFPPSVPYGTLVYAAAHDDGFVVMTHYADETHVLPIDRTGTPLPEIQFPAAYESMSAGVGAIPDGYFVQWAQIGTSNDFFAVLDHSGHVIQSPTAAHPPVGFLSPDTPLVVATSGNAWASTWATEEIYNGELHSRLWFQSYGCDPPPYQ
jgi:hypothetical protein